MGFGFVGFRCFKFRASGWDEVLPSPSTYGSEIQFSTLSIPVCRPLQPNL